MLAPVPPKRSDGGSSFSTLGKYLTTEVDAETGEVRARGEVMISSALLSAETAAAEMKAVAAEYPQCKDPVMHLVLSWQPGEEPNREQWQDAVKHVMSSLKDRDERKESMAAHQYIAVAHRDTDSFHVHIMANRVHPETYRANSPEWLHKTLDKACREIEAAQGWQHSNGLYKWDEDKGKAVAMTREERDQLKEDAQERRLERGTAGTGKASKMEEYSNAESLETYCKGQPAKDLSEVMRRDGVTWQDVHATLMKHGLELHKGQKGGYTVSAEGADGKVIHVKASEAFKKHFAGKTNREATDTKLGPWEAPKEFLQYVTKQEKTYSQYREPKRNRQERAERIEERAAMREDLKARYQAYKTAHYQERRTKTGDSSNVTKLRGELSSLRRGERAALREVSRQQRAQARPERQERSLFAEVRDIVRQEVKVSGFEFDGKRLAQQAARETLRQAKAITKAIQYSGRSEKREDWTEKKVFKTPEFLKSEKERKRDAAIARMEEYKRIQKEIKEAKDERRAITRELRGSLFERITAAVEARAERREERALTEAERKARLSVAVAESVKASELVKATAAQLKAEQDAERKQNRAADYRTWVTERAQEGDRAAIAQLRGWHYQEGRNARSIERRNVELDQRESARPTDNDRHEPADPRNFADAKKSAALRMTWKVDTKTGDVAYQIDGKQAFTDHGERVSFGNGKDADAIEAGLKLAAQKYGGAVHLNGSEEFKKRAVEVAAQRGVNVQFANKELSIYHEAYKHQMQVEREKEEARQRHQREQAQERSQGNNHDFGR